MKFLFTARNPSLFVQYEQVIKGLIDKGHTVEFHLVSNEWRNAKMDTEMLTTYANQTKGAFSCRTAKRPRGIIAFLLKHKREIVNYAAYMREENPISNSPYMADRQRLALFPPMDVLLLNRLIVRYVLKKNRLKKLDFMERLTPADRDIIHELEKIKPDIVVASPFIFSRSTVETEYIKAAERLNIPTCVNVFSWDNLTSKGIFQVIPKTILVWNKMQIRELGEIHGVATENAIATGAPSLDVWFGRKPRNSFDTFRTKHNIPEGPYILYLCSSQTIAKDENLFVEKLIQYMKKQLGGNCPTVIIRPHPLNIDIWEDWSEEGTAVVPRSSRDIFYSVEAKNLMFESIFHSCCVIGLNTTAMIETAIVGKPCFTLLVDEYKNTQEMSGHFHHLEDSDFMVSCKSMGELTEKVSQTVAGDDPYKKGREEFINNFVRPCGAERNSSAIMQEVLERLAEGVPHAEVKERIQNLQDGC